LLDSYQIKSIWYYFFYCWASRLRSYLEMMWKRFYGNVFSTFFNCPNYVSKLFHLRSSIKKIIFKKNPPRIQRGFFINILFGKLFYLQFNCFYCCWMKRNFG
jgi:hypothetical protein